MLIFEKYRDNDVGSGKINTIKGLFSAFMAIIPVVIYHTHCHDKANTKNHVLHGVEFSGVIRYDFRSYMRGY